MSQENVEIFKRALAAFQRGDIDGMLEAVDPEIEHHAAFGVMLGGEAAVVRGHEGVRRWAREVSETLAELPTLDLTDVRGRGDMVVATGRIRTRGKASGAETESPVGYVAEFRNGKVTALRSYLDPREALAVAGFENSQK